MGKLLEFIDANGLAEALDLVDPDVLDWAKNLSETTSKTLVGRLTEMYVDTEEGKSAIVAEIIAFHRNEVAHGTATLPKKSVSKRVERRPKRTPLRETVSKAADYRVFPDTPLLKHIPIWMLFVCVVAVLAGLVIGGWMLLSFNDGPRIYKPIATKSPFGQIPQKTAVPGQGMQQFAPIGTPVGTMPSFNTGQPSVIATPMVNSQEQIPTTIPTGPKLQPIGVKNAPFFGKWQVFFGLSGIFLFVLTLLDAKERAQDSDALVSLVCFIFNQILGISILTGLVSMAPDIFTVQSLALLVSTVSLAIVITMSLTGGRDLSPVSAYIAFIAFAGIIWETMGALQVAFNIPEQPLYGGAALLKAIELRMDTAVVFSKTVYILLVIAIAIYLVELFFPALKEKKAFHFVLNPRWESVAIAFLFVTAFFLLLIFSAWDPRIILVVSVGVASLIVSLMRSFGQGITNLGDNNATKFMGRFVNYTPWDGIALGVVASVFGVLLFISIH